MNRYPSVDRIEDFTRCDRETAIKVRRILDGRDDPESYPAGEKRVRECFHRPNDVDLKLSVIDDLLDTHGIEAIRVQGAWVDSYHGEFVALYCNTGDSYGGTILYDSERGVFYATTWADWVETAERNGRYKFQ